MQMQFDGSHVHATSCRDYRYEVEYRIGRTGVDWTATVANADALWQIDGHAPIVCGDAEAIRGFLGEAVGRAIDGL